MIIKQSGHTQRTRPWKRMVGVVGLVLLLGGLAALVKYNSKSTSSKTTRIFCDAENVHDKMFIQEGQEFAGGQTQSDKEAFEGSHSAFLTQEEKYAFTYKIKDPKPYQKYRLSVWVKSAHKKSGYLVAKTEDASVMYRQTNTFVDSKDGWNKLELTFSSPELGDNKDISIYVYFTKGKQGAFFDNFLLENITGNQEKAVKAVNSFDEIKLHFEPKAYNKLRDKRNQALERGLLVREDSDWVKAKMDSKNLEEVEVKVRLKGDWTDHLKGTDWSFRVKMPSDKAWNGIQTFSLQNPQSRHNLSEWVYHKFLNKVDVLTPRYDFITFKMNALDPKIYAFEEHFEKHLVESQNRREGVIIRFMEDAFWQNRLIDREHVIDTESKVSNKKGNAVVAPFKESKVAKTDKLMEQYDEAQNLLFSYQKSTLDVPEVFNIDKLARYYAVADIMHAFHSTIWHNMRYYYDPIIRKLEPIGFDGFTHDGEFNFHKNLFFGAYMTSDFINKDFNFESGIFRDPEFNTLYCSYLSQYSDPDYINAFIESIEDDLQAREQLLQARNPDYTYDLAKFRQNAREINVAMKPVEMQSLRAYRENCEDNNCLISVSNYHNLPLEYIGSSSNRKSIEHAVDPILIYSNRRWRVPEFSKITVPTKDKYVFYRLAGQAKYYVSEIKKWSAPTALAERNVQPKTVVIPIDPIHYTAIDKKIAIHTGKYTIEHPILIPAGFDVTVEQGVELDFINKSYWLSYSPIQMEGTKGNPIRCTSSDRSSQGIHVFGANRPSLWSFTECSNFNTLTEGNWQLTGAITFYETSVRIDHVTISDNSCEDALNTVRCDIDIYSLHINNTFADGFDGDFCKGVVKKSMFFDTGNDGMDFSGSNIQIDGCTLKGIGDKGISAGEAATIQVKNTSITDAQIGIASKDKSKVEVEGLHIENCNKGFAAYQKKPEFGPGYIKIISFSSENVDFLQIAEDDSSIVFPSDEEI